MAREWCLLLLALLYSVSVGVSSQEHKRVCYFTSWSKYRPAPARYTVSDVNISLCTHIIYAFAVFDGQGNIAPQEGEAELATFAQFNGLKSQNSDLKTLLAVGGWNFGSRKFSLMAGDPVTRNRFVTSSVTVLRQHGYDGLDLDWEYPGMRGGSAKDKDNFVLLCKELRQAFDAEATGSKRLILSAAVPAARSNMDIGYNIPALDRYLDLWNLMTYDYHGAWEGKTGHNSPLRSAQWETWPGNTLNMEWTAKEYVQRGASKHKVIVGLPTYGHSYTLTSPSRHNVGDSASVGPAGPLTRQLGFWAYYEVCNRISQGKGTVLRDSRSGVPYYFDGSLWISYDDVESIKEKTRWLKKNGFGGYMAWSLDLDAFTSALCPSATSPYPLLSAANSVLSDPSDPGAPDVSSHVEPTTTLRPFFGSGSGDTSTNAPTQTGSAPGGESGSGSGNGSGSGTGTGSISQEFTCEGRPYKGYSDPSSPCRFIVCWAGTPHYKTCATGLVFDPSLGVCVWPDGEVRC